MAQKTKIGKKLCLHKCWSWVYYTHIIYGCNLPAEIELEICSSFS